MKTLEKPSFNVLYVLKFPRYSTTWRLSTVTEDGYFIFTTSNNNKTAKMSLSRWFFICRNFVVDTVHCPPAFAPNMRVSINLQKKAFCSRENTKEELDAMIDDIDDVEF
ncbi:MAG: hypothetical protein IJW26_06055 [Clostridia bacterium]|nr:hypothetical protein [Clostridia bacterium]